MTPVNIISVKPYKQFNAVKCFYQYAACGICVSKSCRVEMFMLIELGMLCPHPINLRSGDPFGTKVNFPSSLDLVIKYCDGYLWCFTCSYSSEQYIAFKLTTFYYLLASSFTNNNLHRDILDRRSVLKTYAKFKFKWVFLLQNHFLHTEYSSFI